MNPEIEITIGDVNDVEAHVFARYRPSAEMQMGSASIELHGTLRGPYCETAHTLPAVIMFRGVSSALEATAEAIVPDPCVWSSELPHVYHADIVARQGDRILAEYHAPIGFREGERHI